MYDQMGHQDFAHESRCDFSNSLDKSLCYKWKINTLHQHSTRQVKQNENIRREIWRGKNKVCNSIE